jgi:hypothetical protein
MHISCHVLTTIYFPKLLAGLRESQGPKRRIRIIPQFVSVFHQDISARKIKMTFQPVVRDSLVALAITNLNCFTIGSKKQNSSATRHGGAWGERRYSSYSFLTSALDGDEWSASRPGRAVPIVQEAGWASEPVWTQRLEKKILCPCRGSNLDCPVVQSVARHYTD